MPQVEIINHYPESNELDLRVKLTPEQHAPFSSTGKNKVLFSSGGFVQINGFRVNLTVIPAK